MAASGSISPIVGRVVWFHRWNGTTHTGPLAGHVAKVIAEDTLNLMVISEDGIPFAQVGVPLVQEGGKAPAGPYCAWPPAMIGPARAQTQAPPQTGATGPRPQATKTQAAKGGK